jgi:hypothetical protein
MHVVPQPLADRSELKPWQLGYPLDVLRPITDRFVAAEGDRVLGKFAAVNDALVASRLASGLFATSGSSMAMFQVLSRARTMRAFGDVPVAVLPAGGILIDHVAGDPLEVAHAFVGRKVSGVVGWLPDPVTSEVADLLWLSHAGGRVTSAGEVQGLWADTLTGDTTPQRLAHLGVTQLAYQGPRGWRTPYVHPGALLEQVAKVESSGATFAQHYSGYNKRRSWTALTLRGFGDVEDITKPAEMSKHWKAAHPGWERSVCTDTPLMGALPAVGEYLAALGWPPIERVRLMRLEPGGGELTRHADAVDHDAGVGDGSLCRIHFPLETNPDVVFTSWDLQGVAHHAHMPTGTCWVLDHTKPHSAINGGSTARTHLVIDAWVETGSVLARLLDAAAGRRI